MKFVFTGPESTGKSILSSWLSKETGFGFVTEIARQYLSAKPSIPTYDDVWEIGILQYREEILIEQQYDNIVCDTDLLTIIIWVEDKFGQADPIFYDRWHESNVDMYFLGVPDVPWVPDPLRENPYDRDRLYDIHVAKLEAAHKPFLPIYGDWDHRKMMIRDYFKEKGMIME
ncbi:MAG: ATP-binding protein [Chitinophagales bacterium]|nr:ATP-binding protein [Chitinophagales bacterium]